MESWRLVWRKGVEPLVSFAGLQALEDALLRDDPRLLQGATTAPPPLRCVEDCPVEAACPITLTGWLGDGLSNVGECEEYFARMCYEIDQRLGEPAGCRWFISWSDEAPRDEMRRELLAEVRLAIGARLAQCA